MELKDHVSVFVMLMKFIMDKNVSVQLAITELRVFVEDVPLKLFITPSITVVNV